VNTDKNTVTTTRPLGPVGMWMLDNILLKLAAFGVFVLAVAVWHNWDGVERLSDRLDSHTQLVQQQFSGLTLRMVTQKEWAAAFPPWHEWKGQVTSMLKTILAQQEKLQPDKVRFGADDYDRAEIKMIARIDKGEMALYGEIGKIDAKLSDRMRRLEEEILMLRKEINDAHKEIEALRYQISAPQTQNPKKMALEPFALSDFPKPDMPWPNPLPPRHIMVAPSPPDPRGPSPVRIKPWTTRYY